jgi:WD40 repeat protein
MNTRILSLVLILLLTSVALGGSKVDTLATPVAPTPTMPIGNHSISMDNASWVAQLITFDLATPYDLTWSSDGSRLALASSTGVWVYDIGSSQPPLHLTEFHSNDVSFSSTQNLLASMSSGGSEIQLWDINTGTLQMVLGDRNLYLYSIGFSPDGTRLVSSSWDYTIRLWDISTGESLATFEGHTDVVLSMGFASEGALLISVANGWDHTIRLWDTSTGECLAVKQISAIDKLHDGLCGATLSSDGKLVALGTCTGEIRIWDILAGEELNILHGHTGPVRNLAFNPDGTLLVSGDEAGEIRIWDILAGEELNILHGHTGPMRSLAFNPDGTLLASTGQDNTVRLWGVTRQE